MKFYDTLFKKDSKGEIRYFDIKVIDGDSQSEIVWETGRYNGDPIIHNEVVHEGKNIGKSNETTHYTQAIAQADHKWLKKKDQGYKTVPEIAGKELSPEEHNALDNENVFEYWLRSNLTDIPTDANSIPKPMLAKTVNYDKIEYPCYVQPKIDGVRCMIYASSPKLKGKQGNLFDVPNAIEIHAISRQGKNYDVVTTEIRKELTSYFVDNPTHILDGELYIHQNFVCDIGGLCRRKEWSDSMHNIEFHVFDIAISLSQKKRFYMLADLFLDKDYKKIKRVQTNTVTNEEVLKSLHKTFVELGYEGTIIRNAYANYGFGKRNYNMMKKKDYLEEEFKIIGSNYNEGIGIKSFVFILETSNGVVFESTPAATEEQKQEWLDNDSLWLDKLATVRFFNWTPDGKPFQSHVKTIRDYE